MTTHGLRRLVHLALVTGLASAAVRGQTTCSTFLVGDPSGQEASFSSAFDGANWFVAIAAGPGGSFQGGQLVSPAGLPVGPVLTAGFSGGGNPIETGPVVAYGGGQYLLAGTDAGANIRAQFFSPSGTPGAVLPISLNPSAETIEGIAFDGTRFLVVYQREVAPVLDHTVVMGRFVSSTGTLSAEFQISISLGGGNMNGVAFDGTRYLVAWIQRPNNTAVRARFVSTNGSLSTEFPISQGTTPLNSGSVPVVFDGANHLVVWADEAAGAGTVSWDVLAQSVSPAGTLVGSVIPVASHPGGQLFPFAAFDGANTLVTWTDVANDQNLDQRCDAGEGSCWDVFGQFVAPSGSLVGSRIAIDVQAENQSGGRATFGAGKYLVSWTQGFSPVGGTATDGVHATFLNPNGCPTMTPYCFGDGTGVICPCGNAGASGHGCANSVFASGGRLIGSGLPSVSSDSVVLTGSSMPSSSALYFQGTAIASATFGDGVRCVGSGVIRLGTKFNDASGASFYPQLPGDLPISIRGLVPIVGGTRFYQVWYRNAASFCTVSTFNLTNGLEVVWGS